METLNLPWVFLKGEIRDSQGNLVLTVHIPNRDIKKFKKIGMIIVQISNVLQLLDPSEEESGNE